MSRAVLLIYIYEYLINHINAIWNKWNRFKISAWLFWWVTSTVDVIFYEHPREWWIHFTSKRLLFNWIFLLLLSFLSRILRTAWLFCCFTLIVDMIYDKHPLGWWFHFIFKLRFFSLTESPFFVWELYQGFC